MLKKCATVKTGHVLWQNASGTKQNMQANLSSYTTLKKTITRFFLQIVNAYAPVLPMMMQWRKCMKTYRKSKEGGRLTTSWYLAIKIPKYEEQEEDHSENIGKHELDEKELRGGMLLNFLKKWISHYINTLYKKPLQ